METYAQEQQRVAATPGSSNAAAWEPNEGQLVEAGRLVMDLQRELGHSPTQPETVAMLISRMRLATSQANKIIDELGLY